MNPILRACLDGGVTILLAACLLKFVPFRASVRCWIWRAAILKLAISLFWQPSVLLHVLAPATPRPPIGFGGEHPTGPNAALVAIITLWAIGSAIALVRLALAKAEVSQILRSAEPVLDERTLRLAAMAAQGVGLKCAPRLAWSQEVESAAVTGIVRQTILLSPHLADWSHDELRAALAHELGHVARADCRWKLVLELARTVFWWLPPVWIACNNHQLDAEIATDALVLSSAAHQRRSYGSVLVKSMTSGRQANVLALTGEGKAVAQRIAALGGERSVGAAFGIACLFGFSAICLPSWRLGPKAAQHRPTAYASHAPFAASAAKVAGPTVSSKVSRASAAFEAPHAPATPTIASSRFESGPSAPHEFPQTAPEAPAATPKAAAGSSFTPKPSDSPESSPAVPAEAPATGAPTQPAAIAPSGPSSGTASSATAQPTPIKG